MDDGSKEMKVKHRAVTITGTGKQDVELAPWNILGKLSLVVNVCSSLTRFGHSRWTCS